MSLPEFPPSENKKNKKMNNNTKGGSFGPNSNNISQASFPKLPNLDDLGSPINPAIVEKEAEQDKGASFGLPSLPKLPSFEENSEEVVTHENLNSDVELIQDDEAQDVIDEIRDTNNLESDKELEGLKAENIDSDEDFEDLEDEDFDINNEDDWDSDFNDNFSFLPTVGSEDFEEDFEDSILPGVSMESDEAPNKNEKIKKPKGKGFKELDDESAKEFFVNLKDNILNKLSKKGSKPRIKKPKTKLENKSKIERSKSGNKLKEILKIKNLIYILIFIITTGLTIFLISKFSGGYKTLEDMSTKTTKNNIAIQLKDFHYEDSGDITLKIINEGDMSADFLLEATFKARAFNPFKGEKLVCQSDIIALESAGKVEEVLHCDNFEKDLKYKVDIELIEIK